MTPEQLAAPGSEHAHQTALFCKISQHLTTHPELKWVFAIPNGGTRNPIEAARLKTAGVKSGVSDICVPFARQGYHGFYIEMKKPKNQRGPAGAESPAQKEFGEFITNENYLYKCCIGWEDAWNAIAWYIGINHE